MNGNYEPGEASSCEPELPRVKLVVSTPKPSRFVLTRVALKRAWQVLTLPVVAVVVGVFWGAVDLGSDLLLGAFGAQLGTILVVKPLIKVFAESIREERRIRRIRKCVTEKSKPRERYSRETLQELKLCPGSGCSTQNRRDWRNGKCQHCFQPAGISNNHIVDHLLYRISIGFQPVECDPRLVPVLLRGLGRDQEQ